MPSRRLRLIAIFAIALVTLSVWYFAHDKRSNGPITLYGNVDIRQVDLAFPVDGPIQQVLVDEGATVTPGQVLARLDDESYRHAAAQADAAAVAANAALSKATNGNRVEDIDAARAAVTESQARVTNAETTFSRREALLRERNVSPQTVDDARRDLKVAQATLASRQAALHAMVQGSRPEDIDAARGTAEAAVASAALAHYRLSQTVLVAPAAGTIVTRIREPGAMASTMAPVLTLALTTPVWVRAYAAEPDLGRVAPGTKVSITSDATGDKTYPGTIGFVSPTAEFTPKAVETPELRTDLVYRLRIVVDGPDLALRQGMPVTVTIPAKR
ncbi:MAG: HlyD family efflux transporter periplasmic adaptor subunit [Rhodospirillaceae bacterium]|nr:MAG: HlyD family efflux transporter periplasmic adaptor subunit [Rhodospirillaceae bacterium]